MYSIFSLKRRSGALKALLLLGLLPTLPTAFGDVKKLSDVEMSSTRAGFTWPGKCVVTAAELCGQTTPPDTCTPSTGCAGTRITVYGEAAANTYCFSDLSRVYVGTCEEIVTACTVWREQTCGMGADGSCITIGMPTANTSGSRTIANGPVCNIVGPG
ncbi:MAG: hypothetical protein H7144_10365 [Burkholderiales bacterium]|nr:hypothetical protein [Phycisphaerae bacterium]